MINNAKNLKSAQSFRLRLAQTILWCTPRANVSYPKNCLRTPEIRPSVFERDRFSAVESVCSGRALYGGIKFNNAEVPRNLGGGRLLIYFPETNLYDGAAEDETFGFLDVDNLPGWDTWVAFFEDDCETNEGSYLICWIPPQFIKIVSDGILVNPEECVKWLPDVNIDFPAELLLE